MVGADMGVDLAEILAGVTGLGNVAGQGMNILQTMENWNRYNERSADPLFAQLRNQFIRQYNDSPYGPYGDPSDSFGGLFGRDTAGNPVQYGDWAARQYMGMMQNNPAIAAMNVLNQGAQMQSPGMMSLSDLLSGNPGASQYAQTSYASPTTALPQNLLNPLPDRQVVRAPSQPNPQLNMAEPRDATGIWDTLRRFIGGSAADGGQTSTPATPAAPSAPAPARDFTPATPTNGRLNTSPVGMPGFAPKSASPFAQILGSYATGTSYVPKTGTYQLHQGEAVVPKAQNPVAQAQPQRTRMSQFEMGTPNQPYQQPRPLGASNAQPGLITGMSTDITDRFAKMRDLQTQLGNQQGTGFGYGSAVEGNAWMPGGPVTASSRGLGGEGMSLEQKQQILNQRAMFQPPNSTGAVNTQQPQYPSPQTTQQPAVQKAQNPAAQVATPDMNTARMQNMGALMDPQNLAYLQWANANLNHIMRNPESMGAGVQAQIFNAAADSRDRMLADQQRQIKEGLAGTGMSNSGLQQSLLNQARSSRNTDLTDAMRQIYTQAATQNFQDRLNVAGLGQSQQGLQANLANSAYQQQQGLANTALQQQALQNEIFQSDRNYNSQLASMLASLGQQGMTNQIGLVGELGGLIGQGLGYQNSALSQILQQAYQSYAGPDYAPFGYAPNEFASSLMQQSGGGGGGSNAELWGSLAGSAGQFLGAAEKPWIFGK